MPEAAAPTGRLVVEVTARCHRACSYCYRVRRSDPADPDRELSAAERRALVARVLRESGMRHVELCGGEPLLAAGVLELAAAVRASGAQVSLTTDGALIDASLAAELARLGVAPVQPTLLAADRALHNRLKGADCFDATVAAIGHLRRAGAPVAVAFVCTRENHDAFRSVVELCLALGVDNVAFGRFCPVGEGAQHRAALSPTPAMLAACLDVAEEANARLGMRVEMTNTLPLCAVDERRYRHLRFGRCAQRGTAPNYTLDPAGRVRACALSPVVLGDATRESWADIVARARREYFPLLAVPAICRSCELLARCGGGCRESARASAGDPGGRDPLVTRS